MDVSLVDADFAVSLVSRSELTVGHTVVRKREAAYKYHERSELFPFSTLISCYSDSQSSAYVRFGQLMPFFDIEVGKITFCGNAVTFVVADLRENL